MTDEPPASRFPRIEMIYDPECPNVDAARAAIRGALASIGAPLIWREWDSTDTATPKPLRGLGSPAVLVNGRDVGDGPRPVAAEANSCRIYRDECGCVSGAPSVELVLSAIARTR